MYMNYYPLDYLFSHEDLNKLTYKDKDGAISQISVNKVKSIKILEE